MSEDHVRQYYWGDMFKKNKKKLLYSTNAFFLVA